MQLREACPHYPCLLDLAAWALQQEGPALHPLPRLPEAARPPAPMSAWGHLAEGQKAYCTTGILCPVEGAGGGGTSSESARVSPAGTQLGLQGPRAGEGGLTQERSSVWGQSVEPPWGLQWPQGCCCGQDPTTSWLKSQLLFSRKTSPLGGQAHVFSVCTQGRDLELGVCSSSCKDTSPAESGPPS